MTQRRTIPYPGLGALVCVPAELWSQTLNTIREYGRRESEALVLWAGVVVGPSVQVTGLYLPGHRARGYAARLSPNESRWLLRRLRERDEKLLAQVHSHPQEAFHSAVDDAGAASFHVGYISIVVPRFGRWVSRLSQCAIYEFDGTRFARIDSEEPDTRFRVRDSQEWLSGGKPHRRR